MNSLVRTVARSYRTCNLYNNRTISLTLRNYCSSETKSINQDDIGKMVKNQKVVVFMKGVPEAPRCGFSNAVVQIMRMHGVPYDSHDVLQNDDLREGIKKFTNWPTIPQVFINGEFVGGCDIMLEMHQNGELIEELKKCGIRSALLDKSKEESTNKDEK